eukprot:scpid16538/ scgid31302/ 
MSTAAIDLFSRPSRRCAIDGFTMIANDNPESHHSLDWVQMPGHHGRGGLEICDLQRSTKSLRNNYSTADDIDEVRRFYILLHDPPCPRDTRRDTGMLKRNCRKGREM